MVISDHVLVLRSRLCTSFRLQGRSSLTEAQSRCSQERFPSGREKVSWRSVKLARKKGSGPGTSTMGDIPVTGTTPTASWGHSTKIMRFHCIHLQIRFTNNHIRFTEELSSPYCYSLTCCIDEASQLRLHLPFPLKRAIPPV